MLATEAVAKDGLLMLMMRGLSCDKDGLSMHRQEVEALVAEWIHFTLFGIILPTIKLEVYTFWGL